MTGSSRYTDCKTAVLPPEPGVQKTAAGTDAGTAYLLPRTSPSAALTAPLARHRVAPGDRLDLIAFRYLGDPGAAWRICDANAALDPEDLVGPDAVDTTVVIPVPQPGA